MNKLRQAFIRTTGYWIYKKKHLTTGIDFIIDIENHFPVEFSNIKTIFDVGANVGQSARKFSNEIKHSKIYSFEPEMGTFQKLKENSLKFKNVSIYNIGLGKENDKMELYHGKYSGWNSLKPGLNDDIVKSIVDVKKLDDLTKELNVDQIDILKTDTEGFDINVLKGGEILLKSGKIKFIYIESGFYESNKRNTNLNEIMTFLTPLGYQLFSLYEVAKGGTYMINGNALFVHESVVSNKHDSMKTNYSFQSNK